MSQKLKKRTALCHDDTNLEQMASGLYICQKCGEKTTVDDSKAQNAKNELFRNCKTCVNTDSSLTKQANPQPLKNAPELTPQQKEVAEVAQQLKKRLKKMTPEERTEWYHKQKKEREESEGKVRRRTFTDTKGSVESVHADQVRSDEYDDCLTERKFCIEQMQLKLARTHEEALEQWSDAIKNPSNTVVMARGVPLLKIFGGVRVGRETVDGVQTSLKQSQIMDDTADLAEMDELAATQKQKFLRNVDKYDWVRGSSSKRLIGEADIGNLVEHEFAGAATQGFRANSMKLIREKAEDEKRESQRVQDLVNTLVEEEARQKAAMKAMEAAASSASDGAGTPSGKKEYLRVHSVEKINMETALKSFEAKAAAFAESLKSEHALDVLKLEMMVNDDDDLHLISEDGKAKKESCNQALEKFKAITDAKISELRLQYLTGEHAQKLTANDLADGCKAVDEVRRRFHTTDAAKAVKTATIVYKSFLGQVKKTLERRDKAAEAVAQDKQLPVHSMVETQTTKLALEISVHCRATKPSNHNTKFTLKDALNPSDDDVSVLIMTGGICDSITKQIAAMEYYTHHKEWLQSLLSKTKLVSGSAAVSRQSVKKTINKIVGGLPEDLKARLPSDDSSLADIFG